MTRLFKRKVGDMRIKGKFSKTAMMTKTIAMKMTMTAMTIAMTRKSGRSRQEGMIHISF